MRLASLLALIPLMLIASCSNPARDGGADSVDGDSFPMTEESVADLTHEALLTADSLLASMSLEQRVGQCFMPTIYARSDISTLSRLRFYADTLYVGGIVLLKGILRSAEAIAREASEAEVPMFTAIDAEWGLGMRLEDAPGFPRNGKLSPSADEQLLYDYGREVARECRRVGINMVLGPVVDVVENPRGVIGSRSFGSDPIRVADLGVAYALGLESGGVISVAKHFPGHGSCTTDSHKTLPVIARSLHQLDSIDLYPFRRYSEAGLSGVMTGHLAVPAVDPYSLPAAVSPVVINDLLREEVGFHGLVLTDALNMAGAEGYDARDALKAGADIVIGPADTGLEISRVVNAVERGEISEDIIADRCRRILFYKSLFGIVPGQCRDSCGLTAIPDAERLEEDLARRAVPLRKKLMGR